MSKLIHRFFRLSKPLKIAGLLLITFLVLNLAYHNASKNRTIKSDVIDPNVKITVVSCGGRHTLDVVTLIKSAIFFSSRIINFYIITEKENNHKFVEHLEMWPDTARKKFTYQFHEPYFPSSDQIDWRPIFRTCSTQRLFLPEMFDSVDSMLLVDADVLFFDDVVELWNELKQFNKENIVAFAPDFYSKKHYQYRPAAKFPFYGKLGLNAGIMLMNLTRMREFKLHEKLVPIYQKYKDDIVFGDQCLLNILFHGYPELVYDFDCSWNYMYVYCEENFKCPSANYRGIRALHGVSGSFHKGYWPDPKFKMIFDAFTKYNFSGSNNQIYLDVQYAFKKHKSSLCSNLANTFFKNLAKLAKL